MKPEDLDPSENVVETYTSSPDGEEIQVGPMSHYQVAESLLVDAYIPVEPQPGPGGWGVGKLRADRIGEQPEGLDLLGVRVLQPRFDPVLLAAAQVHATLAMVDVYHRYHRQP